jgi:osmoprotectant transport system ATP-binding protein
MPPDCSACTIWRRPRGRYSSLREPGQGRVADDGEGGALNDPVDWLDKGNGAAPAVELQGVSKHYGEAFAVRSATLAVAKGDFIALVGGSGSGKTTLLKMINKLVEPDEGAVVVDGRAVRTSDPVQLRRSIGYVFQGVGLFPHLTVGENIAAIPRLLEWPADQIAARVDELLDLVDLPRDYAARAPAALSGGQRQRVGVARAIAARPSLVLMDEPFGALDPVTRDSLGQAYRALHDKLALTTLMVTHDVQEAVLLADRIVVMKAGRILADDTPKALLAGHSDPDVAALMDTPRRQAERVRALMAGEGAHG